MHKLGSRLFFSSLVGYLAKPTFLRVTASHCHYMRSIYLMDIHTCVCISNMCVCERACAYVHPTYHFPCCRRALSCRKTPVVLKLGMEVKNMFVCFWVLLGLFEVFFVFFCLFCFGVFLTFYFELSMSVTLRLKNKFVALNVFLIECDC